MFQFHPVPTQYGEPSCHFSTCPTYSDLSQPVPFGCITCPFLTPFAKIVFRVSQCHATFLKTLLTAMLCSKYCRVGEGKPKIYFDKKAAYNCDHLPEYMDKFCSEFDSSVL